MLILGKVVQSTPHKQAAHKSRLKDVPEAIFGKVTPNKWPKRLAGLPRTLRGGVWQLLYINPTTSLECVDKIYPRRIAVLRSQSTSESGLLHPRKSLC